MAAIIAFIAIGILCLFWILLAFTVFLGNEDWEDAVFPGDEDWGGLK